MKRKRTYNKKVVEKVIYRSHNKKVNEPDQIVIEEEKPKESKKVKSNKKGVSE